MKLTFKNVLITGGAGFIGSNIASKLVDKGVNVTVLDSLSEQIHGQKPEETSPLYLSIKDKVKFIKGSVTSREDWLKAIDGQEAIIHLAAETGTGQSMYEIEKYVNKYQIKELEKYIFFEKQFFICICPNRMK